MNNYIWLLNWNSLYKSLSRYFLSFSHPIFATFLSLREFLQLQKMFKWINEYNTQFNSLLLKMLFMLLATALLAIVLAMVSASASIDWNEYKANVSNKSQKCCSLSIVLVTKLIIYYAIYYYIYLPNVMILFIMGLWKSA